MNLSKFLETYKDNQTAIDTFYELFGKYEEINPVTAEQKAMNEVIESLKEDPFKEMKDLFKRKKS